MTRTERNWALLFLFMVSLVTFVGIGWIQERKENTINRDNYRRLWQEQYDAAELKARTPQVIEERR